MLSTCSWPCGSTDTAEEFLSHLWLVHLVIQWFTFTYCSSPVYRPLHLPAVAQEVERPSNLSECYDLTPDLRSLHVEVSCQDAIVGVSWLPRPVEHWHPIIPEGRVACVAVGLSQQDVICTSCCPDNGLPWLPVIPDCVSHYLCFRSSFFLTSCLKMSSFHLLCLCSPIGQQ